MAVLSESRLSTNAKRIMRGLIPEKPTYDHPAAQQSRPFGLNRYILLFIYVVYVFATGGVHYGWRQISSMLMKSGAYLWECKQDPVTGDYIRESDPDVSFTCDKQDNSVQKLFSIAIASQFSMCLLTGFLIDHMGPKFTACLGQLLSMSSWIVLSFCGKSFNAYQAAFALMGLGSDTGFLPTLVISNLFPGSNSLVMALLGAAVSASFAIPVILDTAWMNAPELTFHQLCLYYGGIANGICFITAFFLLPVRSYKGSDQYFLETEGASSIHTKSSDLHKSVGPVADKRHSTYLAEEDMEEGKSKGGVELTRRASAVENAEDLKAVSMKEESMTKEDEEVVSNPRINGKGEVVGEVGVIRQAMSLYFIGIVIYFTVVGIAYVYFTLSAERMLGPEVESFLSVCAPLSFIPCLVIGKCIDSFGIMNIILILNGIGILMYATALVPVVAFKYICVLLYVAYLSVFTSQLYCFIENTFSSKHFGKLLGAACCIGGVISLVSNPLHDYTVGALKGDTSILSYVFIVVLVLVYIDLGMLYILKKRKLKPFNPTKM
eukprot:GHVS01029626.1.p1 GENE.GHVS01029626.1~~GHVS01029626.1.p1  ORF type:complete len:567 (+),score=42.66 GHVS01029626.1:56-1702(+)